MSVEGITSKPSAPFNRSKAGVERRADAAAEGADTGAHLSQVPAVVGGSAGGIDPKLAALIQDNLTAQDALALAAGLTDALAKTSDAIANANPRASSDQPESLLRSV